jgi:hypothetical protein
VVLTYVVGTSELLTGLENHTKESAVQHAGTGEDLVPGVVTTGTLGLKLLLNLTDLAVDECAVRVDTVEAGHVHAGLLVATLAVGKTGGLGQEQDSATEDDSPESRQAVGNAPLRVVGVILRCAVVDHVGSPDTEGDQQLVRTDSRTTDALGNRLGLVHGDDGGQGSNTQTSSKAAHGELDPDTLASDLDDHTDDVEEGRTGDSETTTVGVGKGCRAQTSEKGTDTVGC